MVRTFAGLYLFVLRSSESVCLRGMAAVPAVYIELPFKFSEPPFKSSYFIFKTLNNLFLTSDYYALTLDDHDECFRVMVCQCRNLVTFHGSISLISIISHNL